MGRDRFEPEAERLETLLVDRDDANRQRILAGVRFLDDNLGGLYPGDLWLVVAGTGVGKTALAAQVALASAASGRETYMLALEAHRGEIGARLYYEELGRRAREPKLDYAGWWRGQFQYLDQMHGAAVVEAVREKFRHLHVLYCQHGVFTAGHLAQQLRDIYHRADTLVVDHLHQVDAERTDMTELQAQEHTVNALRQFALAKGVPVVATAHVRKRPAYAQGALMPTTDDIHGSSKIAKVATQVVMVARDWEGPRGGPHLFPTFFRVAKGRPGRAGMLVARSYYDASTGRYGDEYQLGRLEYDRAERAQVFKPLMQGEIPFWAKGAVR